jgi:hypothetical protein
MGGQTGVPDSIATARPDLAAYNEILRMEPSQIVGGLVDILGKKITAYLAGVKDTRTIDAWMEPGRDEDDSRRVDFDRLRLALRIAKILTAGDSNRTVQAWFGGLNPELGDRNPARLLRDGDLATEGEAVLSAARAFVSRG